MSKQTKIKCYKCKGKGTFQSGCCDEYTCFACDGTGKILVHDYSARKNN